MKITVTTSPESFEKANFILARAIEQLHDRPDVQEGFGLTERHIEKAERFRKSLVKAFTKAARDQAA